LHESHNSPKNNYWQELRSRKDPQQDLAYKWEIVEQQKGEGDNCGILNSCECRAEEIKKKGKRREEGFINK